MVQNVRRSQAAWIRVEDKGILTIHDHIITRNYRISLAATDNKQFRLVIKNVQESDRVTTLIDIGANLFKC